MLLVLGHFFTSKTSFFSGGGCGLDLRAFAAFHFAESANVCVSGVNKQSNSEDNVKKTKQKERDKEKVTKQGWFLYSYK